MKAKLTISQAKQSIIQIGKSTVSAAPRQMPIALELVLGLLVIIGIGTGLLLLPGMATRQLSFMEALFTSTSASAVTGLSLFPVSTDLTWKGQILLMCLVEVGGVGLIVGVVFAFRMMGRRVTLGDRLAVASSLGLNSPKEIIVIMGRAITLMVIIEAVGALLLFLHWRLTGIVPAGQAGFYAIFHAVTAYCNAGFDLFYGLPQYANSIPTDPLTLIILGFLIILGGLGIPVYMDLIYRGTARKLTLHTRITLWVTVILIILGWLGLLLSEFRRGGVLTGMPFIDRVVLAWFQSVSARTAGFAGLPGFSNLRTESILLLMILMFIGSAPASTGGGITTGTFAVLWMAVISYARGLDKIHVGRHTLSNKILLRATVVLIASITIVVLATWLILITNNFNLSQVLFEVISAYSTTGLSLGITASLDTFGRLIIIVVMFFGRLGAITIMIALMEHEQRSRLVEYPESTLLVG